MRRPLLSPISGICLLLCGALLGLWLRSYRHVDYVLWKTASSQYSVASAYGRIVFKRIAGMPYGDPGVKTTRAFASSWESYFAAPLNKNVMGFAWVRTVSVIAPDGHEAYIRIGTMPDWFFLLILLAIIVSLAIKRSRKTSLPRE